MKLNQRVQHPEVHPGQQEAYDTIKVGMTLYGYCCGYFGRDSYGDKIVVEKIPNYLVVAENGFTNGGPISNWNDLVKSSNDALEQEMRECD